MKVNIHPYERIGRVTAGLFLSSLAFWGPKNKWYLTFLGLAATGLLRPHLSEENKGIPKDVEEQAKEYFPIESSSEIAAGHPIVGVS